MTYKEALDWLYGQLPMYQRQGAVAFKKDLGNTIALLDSLGNPHLRGNYVHVAGTNGKGSTCTMLASILQSAGYKTGLYTSPHLKHFTERIQIDGTEIGQDDITTFVILIQKAATRIKPSFFEITVAMAFWYFHKENVDIAIIETGLGGRLDSTNVIDPLVSIITRIGFDHMDFLGDTLAEIAGEKAGIIKPGVPTVLGADQPEILEIFARKTKELKSELRLAQNEFKVVSVREGVRSQVVNLQDQAHKKLVTLEIGNGANYVVDNLAGVLTTVQLLRNNGLTVTDEAIKVGLRRFKLKGRMQVIAERPLVIADISHNEMGLHKLFEQINKLQYGKLFLVLGFVRDKVLPNLLGALPTEAHCFFTESHVPRSLPKEELNRQAKEIGLTGELVANVNEGINRAREVAGLHDLIVVCGSTFVVAEIDNL